MNGYPLIRTKWTNEHIMAGVFVAATLYQIPAWISRTAGLWEFAAVLGTGLLLDTVLNFLRHKRPICSVSAAVTAGILNILTPGVPLAAKLLGIAAALVLGKHLWGGTGKNPVNPAVFAVLILSLRFGAPKTLFAATPALLPAMLLSLPFLLMRPYAGLGMMAGIVSALAIDGRLSWANVAAQGVLFWGCLIATDPVTVTRRPWVGAVGSFLAGISPAVGANTVPALLGGIIGLNVLSFGMDRALASIPAKTPGKVHIPSPYRGGSIPFVDLAGKPLGKAILDDMPAVGEILRRIETNGVFGMGGAAFPTIRKIRTLIDSRADRRYLIINGVECDPGLLHDRWLLCNRADEIFQGIRLIGQCARFDRIVLAVRDREGIAAPPDITVGTVPDVYPAGAERLIIRELLGITLSEEAIPAQEGILVLNVQTVHAIHEAVIENREISSKFITVADPRNGKAVVARVRLGAPIGEVIERVFPGMGVVFCGGGQMQCSQAQDEDVVEPGTNYIARAAFPHYKESPQCSRCGFCAAHCPAGLDVKRIVDLVDLKRSGEARKLGADRCMSCGTCSYVCLAGRKLSARVKPQV